MTSLKCGVAVAAWSFASWSAASTLCSMGQIGDIFAYCHGARTDVMGNYRLVDAIRPTLSTIKRFSGEGGEADMLYMPYNNDESFAFQLYALGLDGGFTYAESNAGTYGKAEATRTGVLRGMAVALAMSPDRTRPYWMMSEGRFANTYEASWDASLGLSRELPISFAGHGSVQVGPPDPDGFVAARTTLGYMLYAADANRHYLGSTGASHSTSGTFADTLHLALRLTADSVEDGIAHSRFVLRGSFNLTAAFGGAVFADNTFRLGFQIPETMQVLDAVDGSIVRSVPEPSSALLMALGLLPWAAWQHRQQRSRQLR